MSDHSTPDVSLIVRSIGRAELPRALASIREQSWRSIEIVLVEARPGLDLEQAIGNRDGVRLVRTDRALDRPSAANAGLDAARGAWIGFLDEDDWLDPVHVAGLRTALDASSGYRLAYADMLVHSGEAPVKVHDRGYWKRRAADAPIVSMNSALFSRALVNAHGCRFDSRFELLEDWDFFIQCGEFTDFLHVPQPTAHYDAQAGSSGGGFGANRDDARIKPFLELMTQKWGVRYAQVVSVAEQALVAADTERQRQDWIGVREAALRGLSVDPGNPLLLNRLALAHRNLGDMNAVLWTVRRACDSDRRSFAMRAELAVLERQAGFTERARKVVESMRPLAATPSERDKLVAIEAYVNK